MTNSDDSCRRFQHDTINRKHPGMVERLRFAPELVDSEQTSAKYASSFPFEIEANDVQVLSSSIGRCVTVVEDWNATCIQMRDGILNHQRWSKPCWKFLRVCAGGSFFALDM